MKNASYLYDYKNEILVEIHKLLGQINEISGMNLRFLSTAYIYKYFISEISLLSFNYCSNIGNRPIPIFHDTFLLS